MHILHGRWHDIWRVRAGEQGECSTLNIKHLYCYSLVCICWGTIELPTVYFRGMRFEANFDLSTGLLTHGGGTPEGLGCSIVGH